MSDKASQGKASNPMIALLTGELHQSNVAIAQGLTEVAARGLLNAHDIMRPDHHDHKLRQQIHLLAYPKKTTYKAQQIARERVTKLRVPLMAILWKYGYFTDKAYNVDIKKDKIKLE